MRVVQVIENFSIGGTEKAGCVLAAGLGAVGHEAHVVGRGPGPRYLEDPPHGVTHHQIPEADNRRFVERILDLQPDVVHLHGPRYDEPLIAALHEAANQRRPETLLVVTPVFGRPPRDRATLRRCHTCLIGVYMLYRQRLWLGMTAEEAVRNSIGVVRINSVERTDPPQSTLDPPEVAAARRRELGVPDDAFVVGRVGRDVYTKWSPASEEIVNKSLCVDPSVIWLSIGYPPEKRGRERLEARWGDRFINFPPTPDFLKLAKAFSAMDLQLFFSLWGECFSTTICEAGISGLPTIAGVNPLRDNGQTEQIVDGVNGFIAASPKQAAKHVKELLAAPEKLAAMKQQTYDYANARWTTPQVTHRLLEFYDAWRLDNPLESTYLQQILSEEAEFADRYRPQMLRLLASGPVSRLGWTATLAAVADWRTHKLGRKLKRWLP